MLLSNDALSVAIGPVYDGAVVTNISGGVGASPTSTLVGAKALVQPFASLYMPILSGMILDGKAEHSVGQAAFIPTGHFSAEVYSETATFNFHY